MEKVPRGQEIFLFSKYPERVLDPLRLLWKKYRGGKKIFSFLNIQRGYWVHSDSYGKGTDWARESSLLLKVQRGYWVHSDSYGKCTEESVPGWKRPQHKAGSLLHVVQRLRMSGAILPLPLYTFMTCAGKICLYSYVSGGAGELRNSSTFEIPTAPFKLFISEKKIFHSFIPSFIHSL